jgi:predicted MFS family arabinose efflux permease
VRYSAVTIGYLATRLGWTWPFVVASIMCIVAGLLATQINPNRSTISEGAE